MKKALMMALALVLVVALTIGGTLAYLTDRDSKTNVFTVGDVRIELNEDFDQGATLIPGVDIEKAATVKNVGKNDAWVWVKIAIPSALDNDDASKNVIHFNFTEESVADGLWNWMDSTDAWMIDKDVIIDNVLYNVYTVKYDTALKPGETTAQPVMYKVYMDYHIDIDTNGDWYHVQNGVAEKIEWNSSTPPVMYVSAYAMQAEGFNSAAEAIAAYKSQWGDKGDEYAPIPTIFSWEGVNYVTDGDTATVNSTSGDTVYRGILSDGKTTATEVVINEGITRLNNRALCKAPTIASVALPDSLTYIDESAFQQSGITSIEIPENVTYIGKQAFGSCGDLETIAIRAKDVTIGNYVARACANLKKVYIYSDSVTFESGSMYFTNKENGDASGITFFVKDQAMADVVYSAFSTSHSYGLLIKSLDGATTYYDTLK